MLQRMAIFLVSILAVSQCFVEIGIVAQQPDETYRAQEHYDKSIHWIPMRDGTRLFTIIYSPRDSGREYPVMLFRTPYSIAPYEQDKFHRVLGPSPLFAQDGYIFVYQDVRGKFQSPGTFEVMKPLRVKKDGDDSAVSDESTDTYDTIQWILDHLPNHNGRVGQWGISYPGWQTVMGMIDAHPALKASSPQASPADMFIGDDWHHNGAFRLMYTFHWLARNAAFREGPRAVRGSPVFRYGTPDGYQFFLDLGPVSNANHRYFNNRVPTWNEYMRHGTYDAYWKKRNVLNYLGEISHPVLNVAGWFDAEDFYGPMEIYYRIEKNLPKNKSTLVVGPWRHGGWSRGTGASLGDIRFHSNTAEYYRNEIEFPFFRYHLKDIGSPPGSEAIAFETGSNIWRRFDHWPPRNVTESNLYFTSDGKLMFDQSDNQVNTFDAFTSDPDHPVPFSAFVRNTQGHTWMVEDQRFASRRPDVLVYRSEPLEEDVRIAGPIIAHLKVSTTGTDADWIVKLIDVYPGDAPDDSPRSQEVRMGGYQMLLAGEVMRGKFRNSFEHPEAMVPGEVTVIEFDLRDKLHCFRRGHRIMVQVQSTWFPVIGRNPQRFVDIYHATESDFQTANHRVYHSDQHGSHIKLQILPN